MGRAGQPERAARRTRPIRCSGWQAPATPCLACGWWPAPRLHDRPDGAYLPDWGSAAALASRACTCLTASSIGTRSLSPVLRLTTSTSAVREVPAAHGDPERDPDQLGVLELHSRPLIPVVERTSTPLASKLGVDRLGRSPDGLVLHRHHDHRNFGRRDLDRPLQARVVVMHLRDGGHRPFDADAVAAHDRGDRRAVRAENRRAEGGR